MLDGPGRRSAMGPGCDEPAAGPDPRCIEPSEAGGDRPARCAKRVTRPAATRGRPDPDTEWSGPRPVPRPAVVRRAGYPVEAAVADAIPAAAWGAMDHSGSVRTTCPANTTADVEPYSIASRPLLHRRGGEGARHGRRPVVGEGPENGPVGIEPSVGGFAVEDSAAFAVVSACVHGRTDSALRLHLDLPEH